MAKKTTEKDKAVRRVRKFRRMVAENDTYPLATITYHGPDTEHATKISVGVITSEEEEPIVRHWQGEDIAEDVEAAREISTFIKRHQVQRVIASEMVMSCPHEEGVDYPAGEECPYCSFWKSRSNEN